MNDAATKRIAIYVGSIREGRNAIDVARWAKGLSEGLDAEFELIDLADHILPHIATPKPPAAYEGKYPEAQVREWAELIDSFDGFIFATPEYNASVPGTMKNNFDSIYGEWADKPVGFVAWGGNGGESAVRHWHDIVQRVGMKPVGKDVFLPFREAFKDHKLAATEEQEAAMKALLEAVVKEA
ncbi:NADPH-dependent FMN reductase [Corynebacterium pseudopelargi]|uniref:NADPH azoreductase n=1 Tax=Corynebacterium pseudopelargi TaxID=2080757 RepID=A0A3G6IVU0_9CORY|nr:NAD(P)H-dependent oxidoreductase [Corynebacterium pseudopelargi]AZA09757.1 NADPH azoreductase [Corynebacterium pseudopelargi]